MGAAVQAIGLQMTDDRLTHGARLLRMPVLSAPLSGIFNSWRPQIIDRRVDMSYYVAFCQDQQQLQCCVRVD
jgi:hypothetical protein